MADWIKGGRVLVVQQAPSVTGWQIRTFKIRSLLSCLWPPISPLSTHPPLPFQLCWTTCISPSTPNLHTQSSSLCWAEPLRFSFQLLTSHLHLQPHPLWELHDPLLPHPTPQHPVLSSHLALSAMCYHQLFTHLPPSTRLQVPPGRSWVLVSPPGAPPQPLPFTGWCSKITWLSKLFALPCTTVRSQATRHWGLDIVRCVCLYLKKKIAGVKHLSDSNIKTVIKKYTEGTSLAAQWLRLHAPNAGSTRSIPGGGTKIPHAAQRGQKKKEKYTEGSCIVSSSTPFLLPWRNNFHQFLFLSSVSLWYVSKYKYMSLSSISYAEVNAVWLLSLFHRITYPRNLTMSIKSTS